MDRETSRDWSDRQQFSWFLVVLVRPTNICSGIVKFSDMISDESPGKCRVAFVFSSDPDPLLLERMRALEETGEFEPHAMYWHRTGSVLSYPFSPDPLPPSRFVRVDLPDPQGNGVRRTALAIWFAARVRTWLNALNPSVVHAINPSMLAATRLASLGRKLPIVYDIWDLSEVERLSNSGRLAWRVALSKTKQVFTTSEQFIDQFLEPNGLLASRAALHVSNAPYFVERVEAPRDAESLLIGCVGNIRLPNQIDSLVAAVRKLREDNCDIRLRLSGAGSSSQLATQLASENDFIEYTGPFNYYQEVTAVFGQLDLVFAVYPRERFNYRVHVARRLHDAILSGTPVVVSRGTHMSDLVETSGVGWSVQDDSPRDMVELIRALYHDRTLLEVARGNAVKRRRDHCFERYRDRYVEAYRAVVCPSPRK